MSAMRRRDELAEVSMPLAEASSEERQNSAILQGVGTNEWGKCRLP
jgi:hypothetical protein